MKKIGVKVLSAVLATTALAMPLTACGGNNDDPNTLNVVCLDKGYGTTWIRTIADKFKEQTGYKVNLVASADADTTITSHLASSKNTDDLYINVGSNWKAHAAHGKFASLDDLMDEEVTEPEGSSSTSTATVKDRVLGDYSESIYYPDRNGSLHTYRLPWTAGVGGIYYNAKMFEDNGWTIPTTQAELVELCDTIRNDGALVPGSAEKVKPFIYTSANTDYFDYLVYTWWAQLAGKEAITEFCKYSSPSNYDISKAEDQMTDNQKTYAKLKTATEAWYEIFSNGSNYTSKNTNHDAQRYFAMGYAAMMVNGDWVYNEIERLQIDTNGKFELGYMKTPTIEDATHTDITYTVGEDQYIAIPKSSSKKRMAKDFIKLMISDWGCEVFANQAHGILAYTGSLTATTDNAFMTNLINVKQSYTEAFTDYPPVKDITNVNKSTAMINLNDMVNIWGTSAYRPFQNLLGGKTTVNKCFQSIATGVSQQWSGWKKDVGI